MENPSTRVNNKQNCLISHKYVKFSWPKDVHSHQNRFFSSDFPHHFPILDHTVVIFPSLLFQAAFLQCTSVLLRLFWKFQFIHAAAAAAKSRQLCLTLCDPIDGSPPGSPVPGILQARTLEWAAISFSTACKWKVKVKLLSHVRLLATPWTAAYQAPPSMGFSRQEYRSGWVAIAFYEFIHQIRSVA